TGAGNGRRAVLETGQPPRRVCRPHRWRTDLVLYADPAAARLATGNVSRPAVAVHHRPALRNPRPYIWGNHVAGRQRDPVFLGFDIFPDPRCGTLAGQPLYRPGASSRGQLSTSAGSTDRRPVAAGGTLRGGRTRSHQLLPFRPPPWPGVFSQAPG